MISVKSLSTRYSMSRKICCDISVFVSYELSKVLWLLHTWHMNCVYFVNVLWYFVEWSIAKCASIYFHDWCLIQQYKKWACPSNMWKVKRRYLGEFAKVSHETELNMFINPCIYSLNTCIVWDWQLFIISNSKLFPFIVLEINLTISN